MKILIGGSPCTYWSIAKTKNRETGASGIGWELFLNYRIARDKYQPDYFLYENNKSMSPAIRAQITAELGVEPVLINSALVSAQNRQRFYWVGKREPDGTYSQVAVKQPEDRGILLRDILESCDGTAGIKPLTEREMDYMVRETKDGRNHFVAFPYFHDSTRRKSACVTANTHKGVPYNVLVEPVRIRTIIPDGKGRFVIKAAGEKKIPVYEVRDGRITVKGKTYLVKLADGFYIIRKLTVPECKRLQTVPDTYAFPVSDTQAYKMLGNGWTVDVIAHIMRHFTGLTEEPVEVLSMYDGMSCGHIALDKLGAEIIAYYATEIDKYAVQTTQHNYPDTIQLGDAFRVRAENWHLPEPAEERINENDRK